MQQNFDDNINTDMDVINEDDEDENQDKVLQLVNKHIRTLASKVFQIYLQSF